jgi:hypothetical protein
VAHAGRILKSKKFWKLAASGGAVALVITTGYYIPSEVQNEAVNILYKAFQLLLS